MVTIVDRFAIFHHTNKISNSMSYMNPIGMRIHLIGKEIRSKLL